MLITYGFGGGGGGEIMQEGWGGGCKKGSSVGIWLRVVQGGL